MRIFFFDGDNLLKKAKIKSTSLKDGNLAVYLHKALLFRDKFW